MNEPAPRFIAVEAKLLFREPMHPGSSAIALPAIVILVIFGVDLRAARAGSVSAGCASSTSSCRRCGASPWRRWASRRCRPGWPPTARRASCAGCRRRRPDPVALLVRPAGRSTWSSRSAALVVLVVGRLVAFDVPLPQHPLGFVARSCWGWPRCSRSGCSSPRSRRRRGGDGADRCRCSSTVMFLGGVYLPRGSCRTSWSGSATSRRPGCRRCRTPGRARAPQLAAAGRAGRDHRRRGRGRGGEAVPLGVSGDGRAPTPRCRAGADTAWERWNEAATGAGSPYAVARPASTVLALAPAATASRASGSITLAVGRRSPPRWIYLLFTRLPAARRAQTAPDASSSSPGCWCWPRS